MKVKFLVVSSIALGLIAGSTQAATSTANVQMLININSNTGACTVTPSTTSFNLPNGTPTMGGWDYMKAAGFTQPELNGGPAFIAGSTYDQTVSIACAQPNTVITSILVVPGVVTYANHTGTANLLDDAGNMMAGGAMSTAAELVSLTSQSGTVKPNYSFESSTQMANPYTVPFMTSSALDPVSKMSTASFVWHPTLWNSSPSANTPLGNPVGGHYKNPWVVTVNY